MPSHGHGQFIQPSFLAQDSVLEKRESREVLLVLRLSEAVYTMLTFCDESDSYVKFIYDEKNILLFLRKVLKARTEQYGNAALFQ